MGAFIAIGAVLDLLYPEKPPSITEKERTIEFLRKFKQDLSKVDKYLTNRIGLPISSLILSTMELDFDYIERKITESSVKYSWKQETWRGEGSFFVEIKVNDDQLQISVDESKAWDVFDRTFYKKIEYGKLSPAILTRLFIEKGL